MLGAGGTGLPGTVDTTTGTTGTSVMPRVPVGCVLGGAAGALSPPAPAPVISGARNSATASALACSRVVTVAMNSAGPSAIWGAERRSAKTRSAAGGDSGGCEKGSVPGRLQLL